MQTVTIDNDIRVMYVTASSFPDGVLGAHQKLHALVPQSQSPQRRYFGLSRPEGGFGSPIVYRAAAEELQDGEAVALALETIVLKKGNYISITIHNFMSDIPAIGDAFQQLLQHPGIDPQGYCVEWYYNETDVHCMVRLAD